MEDNDTFENISCKINGETELMEAMGKKKKYQTIILQPSLNEMPTKKT